MVGAGRDGQVPGTAACVKFVRLGVELVELLTLQRCDLGGISGSRRICD